MKHLLALLLCITIFKTLAYTIYHPSAYAFANPSQQAIFVSINSSDTKRNQGKSFVFDALTKELLYTSPQFFDMNDVELCSNKEYLFCEFSETDKKNCYQKIVVYYKGLPHDSLEWKTSMKDFIKSNYSYTEEWKEDAQGIYFQFNNNKVLRYSFDNRTFDTVTDPDERKWLFCYRSEAELITDIFSAELLNVGEETSLPQQLSKDLKIHETVSVKLKLTIDWNGVIEERVQVESVELTKEEKEELRKQISKQLKNYRFTEPLYLKRTGIWHYEMQFFGAVKSE